MARRGLPENKRKGEMTFVYLRPTERQRLEDVVETSVEFASMSAVLREGFVAGLEGRPPRWSTEREKG